MRISERKEEQSQEGHCTEDDDMDKNVKGTDTK